MTGCSCPVCRSTNPKDTRLRVSVLIEYEGNNIVIDCSPDFRYQMVSRLVKKVDAIIFTHSHKDHTGGLDDIRGFNYVQKAAIPIYIEPKTLDALKRQYDYIFLPNDYPGIPQVDIKLIGLEPFKIKGLEIIPIRVFHYKMEVLGYRVGDFTYITDAKSIPAAEMEKIRGTKILVINAVRKEPHISHFSLSEAIAIAKELEIESTYLTHISHQMGFHAEVEKELPENVHLAFDGLMIDVS